MPVKFGRVPDLRPHRIAVSDLVVFPRRFATLGSPGLAYALTRVVNSVQTLPEHNCARTTLVRVPCSNRSKHDEKPKRGWAVSAEIVDSKLPQ